MNPGGSAVAAKLGCVLAQAFLSRGASATSLKI